MSNVNEVALPVAILQVTAQVAGFGLLNFPSGCQTQPHLRSIDLTNNRIAEIPKYLYLMENLGPVHALPDPNRALLSCCAWPPLTDIWEVKICRSSGIGRQPH
jgi:hypothetical protein